MFDVDEEFVVTVYVDGGEGQEPKPLPEYPAPASKQPQDPSHTHVYIESHIDRNYYINIAHTGKEHLFEQNGREVRLSIDGRVVSKRTFSRSNKSYSVKGLSVSDGKILPFVFARPVMVEEGGEASEDVVNNLGRYYSALPLFCILSPMRLLASNYKCFEPL